MISKFRFNATYIMFAIFGVMTLHSFVIRATQVQQVPYNEFQQLLKEGKVAEVVITRNHIRGELNGKEKSKKNKFITTRVDADIAKELSQYNIKFTQQIENTLFRDILSWVLPVLVFFGLWMVLMKRFGGKSGLGGSFMSIGKSKAKVYVESDTKVTFKDVAGVDEATAELKEIVDFLKNPKDYGRLGGRMPKGVLLVGPPGTGKTLIAKAVAGEAGVPFFSISGSEFVEMFVGVGAARVRDLFEQARKKAPCIIFIDELDALGRARSSGFMGGHDEKEQTLNQLLVELDGFDSTIGLILLAATNRPEILDPALLRAGRFDRQVLVDRPDKKGRVDVIKVHIHKVTLADGVKLDEIAGLTPGFTGADLANLVNEAALMATRRGAASVAMEDFTSAIERIVAGLEKKNRLLNPKEREVVAHHEMGHALVAASIPGSDPVHKISIIPRGIGALGYTLQRPLEDRFIMTKEELENKMAILLGGRAAEKIVFNHLSTGASDDISKATEIARNMVTRYGMEGVLGHVTYGSESVGFLGAQGMQTRLYSETTAREIDTAVKTLVAMAYKKAESILETNKNLLVNTARHLLVKETLIESELQDIFKQVKRPGEGSVNKLDLQDVSKS